ERTRPMRQLARIAPRVYHRTDARGPIVQRNEPKPAVAEGCRQNVARDIAVEPLRIGVVAEDRQVLEERIELTQAVAPPEHRLLAAGVDDVAGARPQHG